MATRATYLLPAAWYSNQRVCFYIHYDGYLEGGATYFYKMQQCKNTRGGLAGRFFRANPLAEFTKDHEEHGNTEFRYTINHQEALTVWQRKTDSDKWCIVYEGAWHQFVNQHLEASKHLYPFKLGEFSENVTIMTIVEAQRWVRKFENNQKKYYYRPYSILAVQAQIDEILSQNRDFSPVSNELLRANLSLWQERFALFSVEIEHKIARWLKKNQTKYCRGNPSRAAEKFERDFGLFFDNLIEVWSHGSGILASSLAFDFRKGSNLLYVDMVERYGTDFHKAIKAAKTA